MMKTLAAAALCAALLVPATLNAQAEAPQAFPDRFYFNGAPRQLEGKKMPKLQVTDWTTKAPKTSDLEGKVVLIDFWGTWCPPCRAALPKNVKLWKEHKDDGLVVIGVHDSKRGVDKMNQVMRENDVTYPNAVDDDGKSVKAYGVRFWPTYVAVDHKGVVRAVGLNPHFVPEVVDVLLKEREADLGDEGKETEDVDQGKPDQGPPADASAAEIPSTWLEGDKGRRNQLASLENGKKAPALRVGDWTNMRPTTLAKLEGKVVLLDFWATWCGPCIRSIPHNNELAAKYADQGLVVVGVCHSRGAEKMKAAVKEHGIQYPVCADDNGKTVGVYKVDSFPDYYFIDRAGRLRIADCRAGSVEDAIKLLLAEPAPADSSN